MRLSDRESPQKVAQIFDSGLAALAEISRHHRISMDPSQLRHEMGLEGVLAAGNDIVRTARKCGLKARVLRKQSIDRLQTIPTPAIIGLSNGTFAVLRRPREGLIVFDPRTREAQRLNLEEIEQIWSGEILLFRPEVRAGEERFGIGWFAAAILRYKWAIAHILIASLFIQIFALITPLLFQVVIDKALVHKSTSTLTVVAVTMIAIGIFDAALQYLRTYALSHTSSRIDVELGSRLFDRLLHLPIDYFEKRPAGQTVARMRELENVRGFLTGQGLSSFIDAGFTIIFLSALFIYSVTLTLIVLATIPLYLIVIFLIRPVLRERVRRRFDKAAESQQFLVESVIGIATVKAAAVEPLVQRQWEERLAAYVRTAFQSGMLASIGQNAIQYIGKATTALILLFGALEVIAGRMTVGELVAFNMISGQLTAPIIRLSALWQDFQQIQVSVERIGDIYNAELERSPSNPGRLPDLKGDIRLQNITFRYRPDGPAILSNVSLHFLAGQVIGIVGASGSGKSTLAKLIQRLYLPNSGALYADDIDVAQVPPAWLRRQIGVVLQENVLFNRSVHENIAFATPGMPRNEVVRISRLAGADDFIQGLPYGYDTIIHERGANLSGGQRQRIAIARALARNPRILIFDEATSALDYESERIIRDNMKAISTGRTVIVIAHRLAAVRDCDRIIGIERGRVVEDGSHDELLHSSNGLYARLWAAQNDIGSAS